MKLPLSHANVTSAGIMYQVLLALIPGVGVLVWAFGYSIVTQIMLAVITAMLAEALIMYIRKKPLIKTVFDGSGIVTAVLLAISLPPAMPWWSVVIGILFAIVIVKHLYGGIGHNIFNPAMMGFVVLIIAFPKEMTAWVRIDSINQLSVFEQLSLAFASNGIDSFTGATPLSGMKDAIKQGLTVEQHLNEQSLGLFAIKNWEYINFAFLLGGIFLLVRRIISWHIPLVLLLSFSLLALIFHLIDPGTYYSPGFQAFAGGTMLGAFFIATDPVTTPSSHQGKIIFALIVGLLEYLIRTFGGYPDGVAFAVVIANMFSPLIDHYTGPRSNE